jgi:hypothetical protein
MNETDGIVRMQVEALMELLSQSRDAQCRETLEGAALQAAELRRRARRAARERIRKAAREERARLEREVRIVEAELHTEQRKRARARDMALIATGRAALADALEARWRDVDAQRAWTEATIGAAAEVLLKREWLLEHPAEWPGEACAQAVAFARSHCGASLEPRAVPDLAAGLRIRAGGALVDMSIPGLLANERAMEGELLAEFNRMAGGEIS